MSDETWNVYIWLWQLCWICQVGRAMVAKLQERGLENCSDVQALEQQP